MIPSAFVVLATMPLTANGKINRAALPAPEHERSIVEDLPPRTPFEATLAEIWRELLHLETISVRDDFFERGGHSLMATRLVSRIREKLEIEIPIRVIFEKRTIEISPCMLPKCKPVRRIRAILKACSWSWNPFLESVTPTKGRQELGRRIAALAPAKRAIFEQRLAAKRQTRPVATLTKRLDSGPAPLSFAQERLWFLALLEPGSSAYNMGRVYRLKGVLNIASLEQALHHIQLRHEILRTIIRHEGNEAVQIVVPECRGKLAVVDCPNRDMEAARRLACEEISRPFDLTTGPLMRVAIFRLAADDHLLTLTFHHIAFDGWSGAVFNRELSLLYDAFCEGRSLSLPVLPIQYSDYAVWQRQQLAQDRIEAHLSYWRQQLSHAPLLELPSDHPRPPIQSFTGDRVLFSLSSDLSAKLRAFNRDANATAFMTLLTAYQVLLSRYSGQQDILVGSPVANRPIAELEQMVGLFVNTLTLRADLSAAPSFRELVARTRQTVFDAYQYQDLPFEKLVQELNPQRDTSRHPIFQVSFALQNFPFHQLELFGLEVSELIVPSTSTRFDLELSLCPHNDFWRGLFSFSTALFDASTIERLALHYQVLVEALLNEPDRPVSDLSLLSKAEREELLLDWNNSAWEYPREKCFDQLFDTQTVQTPDAVAAVSGERQLTYGELGDRSSNLALRLQELGVKPEVLVGICMERSVDMLVALLGILKAGGAYVPLDPTYPKERLDYILEDALPRLILTEQPLAARLFPRQANVVCFESFSDQLAVLTPPSAPRERSSESLAYVLYTSGSTGKPKGVEITHRSLVNFLSSMSDVPGLSKTDSLLAVTTLAFDIAGLELFLPLMVGARVVIAASGDVRDGAKLLSLIDTCGATVMQATPVTWRMLLAAGWQGKSRLKVLCGGEAWPRDLAEDLLERCESLWNMYGPTETTIWSAVSRVEAGKPVVVGGPIGNTSFYILDEQRQPVPVGVPGELYIGGEGVARGYHKRPELTAERFISDPFQRGNRLYRTGDLARYLDKGRIEFLGRMDNQVKIRGFRIELGEIEATLRQSEGVAEVVVVARQDGPGDKKLVAYVVGKSGHPPPDTQALRTAATARLPDYMVPTAYVVLEKLPLTPNGKVDRRALPMPEEQGESHRAPRTPHEEILCELFADVLGAAKVGIDDNFFNLGGHSLLAMQLVSRIRNTLEVELPVRAVFEAPTAAELATRLPGAHRTQGTLSCTRRPERPPLSHAQERFWFLNQLEGAGGEYKVRETLRLKGELDVAVLEKAIQALVVRHESLRTRFEEAEGSRFQIVEPAGRINLSGNDLSPPHEEPAEKLLTAALRRQTQEPFSLNQGPLLKIGLFKLGPSEHVLHCVWHHIVTDGWSLGVFRRDLFALYAAFREGRPADLPKLPIQYADYAAWQRESLGGENLERLLGYWRNQLQGIQVLELPLDRPRPSVQTHIGAKVSLSFPDDLSGKLRELSRRENLTVFMSLLTALKVMLFRYTGQEDVSVGIPIANRGHAEVEHLIGCLLNTLVLRSRLCPDMVFRDLLQRVRDVTLEAYAHAELPFERLLEELQPERRLNRTPLFQVFVNFTSFDQDALNLPGFSVEKLMSTEFEARFDLNFYIFEYEGRLRLDLVYSTDLFEASSIERMLERFRTLLEAIVADPTQKIGALPLLAPLDRKTYAVADNRVRPVTPYIPFPREETEESIAARFEKQVKAHAANEAVRTRTHQWTYAELDQRANVIAREMLRLLPEAGQRVALLLDHDAPMVAAILACLKAGKTYVPLPPGHPRERIARLIADAEPQLLVTDAANKQRAREFAVGEIQLVDIDAPSDHPDSGIPAAKVSPDSLAYLLYTSGSTGEPKGIAQSHRNVLYHIRNYTNNLQICSSDRMLLLASYGFDAAVMDIFGALLNGATLLPFDLRKHDFVSLANWITTEHATIYHSTPSVFRDFLRAIPKANVLHDVRLVVMGGEPLLSQDLQLFRERFSSGCIIVNGFGQSEYSFSLQYFADAQTEISRRFVPIGYPVDGTEITLLDADGHPDQVFGEIALRSPYLVQGYWRRPELSAATFKSDSRTGNTITYRTGDLARLRADGTLEFAGRKDFQVKVRGNRVEFGEIEAVLQRHSEIHGAVIVGRHSAEGEMELVAYVVPKDHSSPSPTELRDFLAKSLPDYMIPSAFVVMDKMPITPNGKIDRAALPAPERQRHANHPVAALTPTEQIVRNVWANALKTDDFSMESSFFELGGHSLLAIQVVTALRRILQVEMPVNVVFDNPTVATLSRHLDRLVARNLKTIRPPIEKVSRGQALPLTFAQERLWRSERHGVSPDNVKVTVLDLRGDLNIACLERSLEELVRRHEVFRTTFDVVEDVPVQRIAPYRAMGLHLVDLTESSDLNTATARLTFEAETEPISLKNGTLMRFSVLRCGPRHHRLIMKLHHILYDIWSLPILYRELEILYRAFCNREDAPLPELKVQVADFAVWQRQYLAVASTAFQAQLTYWKRQLAGTLPILKLPCERDRELKTASTADVLAPFKMSDELSTEIRLLTRREGTTLFITFLTALKALINLSTGQNDIMLGAYMAKRNALGSERMIGYFCEVAPLRTRASSDLSFLELLDRVRETVLNAHAHEEMPFDILSEELKKCGQAPPEIRAIFMEESFLADSFSFGDLQVEPLPIEAPRNTMPWNFQMRVRREGNAFCGRAKFDARLHDPDRVRIMMRNYVKFLESVVTAPSKPLCEIEATVIRS